MAAMNGCSFTVYIPADWVYLLWSSVYINRHPTIKDVIQREYKSNNKLFTKHVVPDCHHCSLLFTLEGGGGVSYIK